MPTRNFKQYLIISAKGLAMGAADAVPGVSGGTIAFISGIYEELILTISNINLSLFKILKERGISEFWKQLNGNFIIALLTGIAISFISFMKLAKYLIENQPILIWSFFFGLIIASIAYIGKKIKTWNIKTGANLNNLLMQIMDKSTLIGCDNINNENGPYLGDDNKFNELPTDIQDSIKEFNGHGKSMRMTIDEVMELAIENRDIIFHTLQKYQILK